MEKNLQTYDRAVRIILGAIFIFIGAYIFHNTVAKFASILFGAFAIGEGIFARCALFSSLGVESFSNAPKQDIAFLIGTFATQITIAYEWFAAGLEKVSNPEFVSGITKTLGFFASKNPFQWYKNFLLGFGLKNATAFAYAVEYGELAAGVGLAIGVAAYAYSKNKKLRLFAAIVSVISLIGGIILNLNFYFAAGWTGSGTHGVNVIMFWVEAALLYVWLSLIFHKQIEK